MIRGAGGQLLKCVDAQWVPVASLGNWWSQAYYGAKSWAGQQYGTFSYNLSRAARYGNCAVNANYRCFTR